MADNVIRWSSPFLGKQAQVGSAGAPHALTLGESGSIDAGELVVIESGDRMDVPDGTVPIASDKVVAATVNGQRLVDQALTLPSGPPPAPSPILLDPTLGRVQVPSEPGAYGEEYRLGSMGAYFPVAPGVPFIPAGLFPARTVSPSAPSTPKAVADPTRPCRSPCPFPLR